MDIHKITRQKYWPGIFLTCLLLTILLVNIGQTPAEVLAAGNTYYVATTGSDSNPGTIAQPWKTIQKAANTLAAGDTVYIRAGTYQEQVISLNSGSAGNTITYAAYPGETVTIDGTGLSLPNWATGLFVVEDRSYIKVSGLRIINAGPNQNNAGIYVDNSHHIIIEKNYTYNTVSSGIGVWGSNNITIDGNEVELACNDGEQEDITVDGTNTFEIKNNHVHHGGPGTNGGEGIDAKNGSFNGKIYKNHVHHLNRLGIYIDAWSQHTYNIEVYQNVVHDITGNDGFTVASEAGGLLENIRFYNNIAYNNGVAGFNLSRNGPSAPRPMKDITVINNTFYSNGSSGWGGGIVLDNPDIQNAVIRNNIVSQNATFQIDLEADVPTNQLTIDYNLINGYRGYVDETRGSNYVEGDPQFVNAGGANFHLQNNSPAIDAGSATAAPGDDYEGNARPQDGDGNGTAAYDIGAYEVAAVSLSLSSATDPQPVQPSTTAISYTITLQNSGGITATGVTITGTIPNSTTYSSGGDSFDGANVVWTGLTVAGNSSISVSFQVDVTGVITNGDKLVNAILAGSAEGVTAALAPNVVTVGGLRSIYLPVILRSN